MIVNQAPIGFFHSSFRFSRGLVNNAFMFAAVVSSALASLPAAAQSLELDEKKNQTETKVPDLENGLTLARKLCTTCHLVGEPANASVPADVPTFRSIANRPSQSAEALTNWLLAPHAPMPDPHLTRKEIRDLAGYILSLRAAD